MRRLLPNEAMPHWHLIIERLEKVAARLGMSEANVKVTAHRGYRALRRRIEEWTRAD